MRAFATFIVMGKNILMLTDGGELVLFAANPAKFEAVRPDAGLRGDVVFAGVCRRDACTCATPRLCSAWIWRPEQPAPSARSKFRRVFSPEIEHNRPQEPLTW